jgi:hypothetical protein
LCPNHGVARDEAGEGLLRPILRSWGTLRYDNIAPFGRGVPEAYLDIRIEFDAKLPQNPMRVADGSRSILR